MVSRPDALNEIECLTEEIIMKYRKLFFLSLPLSLIGLKKVIGHHHEARSSRHCGRWPVRDHMMKFLAWRLGLTPDQKLKLEELRNKVKTDLKPFSEKHTEVRNILSKEFRKEQFETEQLSGQFTPEILDEAHEVFLKSIGELHDILTPMQRDKIASHFERHHCFH